MSRKFFTPPQVGELYGSNADTVRQWIRNGELEAVNLGNRSRPRWRISNAALEAFERKRSNLVSPPLRVSRRNKSTGVKKFFCFPIIALCVFSSFVFRGTEYGNQSRTIRSIGGCGTAHRPVGVSSYGIGETVGSGRTSLARPGVNWTESLTSHFLEGIKVPAKRPTGRKNGKPSKPQVKGDASQEFGGEYYSGDLLLGMKRKLRGRTFKIARLEKAEYEDGDSAWIVSVDGFDSGFRINKTSGRTLAKEFGTDMSQWIGRDIEIEVREYANFPPGVNIEPALDDDDDEETDGKVDDSLD